MANEFKVRKGLVVNGSGSVILDVQGSQGQLFSVTDQLSGSLFSVNDISGVPVLEAFSDSTVKIGQYLSEAIVVSGSTARITGSIAMAGFSSGSVLFAGPGGSISQNNASFFWDNVNGRLGINNTTPAERLDVNGAIRAWTSLQLGQFASGVLTVSNYSRSVGAADYFSFDNNSSYTAFAGTYSFLRINNNIAPTTGSAIVNQFLIQGTINQTGGANGITRGLYVNPTVTAAANFRSIEWSTNAATSPSQSWGLYGVGSAPNYLSGSLSIGSATNEGLSFQYSPDNTLGGSFASRIVSLASGVAYRDLFLVSRAVLFQQQGYINSLYISPNGNTVLNSLTDDGVNKLQVSGSTKITQALTASAAIISGSGTQRLTIVGSGSAQPLFTVQGSQGELFSIVDSLSGSLFSVNDQSGLPIMEVFSDNTILMGNYLDPMLLTTARTSSAAGINTLYTLPTSSYDAVYIDYTIRSGSNARAGNFMAMWSGTSVNFTDNSITEFGTTSGFVFGAHVSGSNMVVTGSSSTSGWTVKTIIKAI
jgi:hypothetical protein